MDIRPIDIPGDKQIQDGVFSYASLEERVPFGIRSSAVQGVFARQTLSSRMSAGTHRLAQNGPGRNPPLGSFKHTFVT
jgi:hypothetical protein